jgi:hypothetical protein
MWLTKNQVFDLALGTVKTATEIDNLMKMLQTLIFRHFLQAQILADTAV